jgi:hypothetical protein
MWGINLRTLIDGENIAFVVVAIGVAIVFCLLYATNVRPRGNKK